VTLLALALAAAPLWVGRFPGEGAIPAPWRIVRLNREVPPTAYGPALVSGVRAMEARANKSMALLARPVSVDLSRTPILCWRWLVEVPVGKADMRTRRGDDYAAPIYVSSR
jgi:hypothetical protein